MTKEWIDYKIKELIKLGYLTKDAEIIKCWKCDSKNLEDKIVDTFNNNVSEVETMCKDCNTSVGYWAYGTTLLLNYLEHFYSDDDVKVEEFIQELEEKIVEIPENSKYLAYIESKKVKKISAEEYVSKMLIVNLENCEIVYFFEVEKLTKKEKTLFAQKLRNLKEDLSEEGNCGIVVENNEETLTLYNSDLCGRLVNYRKEE